LDGRSWGLRWVTISATPAAMTVAATPVRQPTCSESSSHPSATATTGFTKA